MQKLRWRPIPRLTLCTRALRDRAPPADRATLPAPSPMHPHPHALPRPPHHYAAAAAAFSALPQSGSSTKLSVTSGSLSCGCRSCCVFFRSAVDDGCSRSTGPCWAVAAAWRHASIVGGRRGFRAAQPLEVDPEKNNAALGCSNEGEKEEGGKEVAEEKQQQQSSSSTQRARERRQRGASGSGLPVGNFDLLNIPGVGPANLRKLVEKGIGGLAELKQLYKNKFFGKPSEKMVEFLQSSVGIVHKNHAESITTFVKGSVDEDLKEVGPNSDAMPAQRKRLTFCVEGNISVGKTTFLRKIANETLELRDLVEVVPEPISKWQNVGPNHFNILDAFYAEPHRYAYTFQNYVFVTRVMQERESAAGIKPLRLMERSVFSDRMVFVRAVHEAHWMNEMEISIYDSWFDPVVSCLPGLIPDAFIYLRASPDTCHKRMMLRKREEEGGVPALVLDCEPDIDFSKDIEAKRDHLFFPSSPKRYARQVAEFFEFVKKKKEASPAECGASGKTPNQQLVLPHEGGLWMPKGCHLPESLKSLNFGGTMPFFSG
ncbi:hypothetical protein Taro_020865 [Colocasia esculenta]|uniref:Deoxynucleoside kinase domain-containing protein n=1 Tax=Colocasia esculenta TaxID=4460 RepID=A0A843UZX1_COLES|nr:hypothetical protein [Colocasia esculenta]